MKKIVIVGGGTAGWLSAALIASQHNAHQRDNIDITLVESSDIPTVGVGEGTWPTMKNTLRQIGISESELFRHCHAAFKQGGKFVNWTHQNDAYYHPFTLPLGYGRIDLAPYVENIHEFAEYSNFQHHVCEAGLAPRKLSDQEFQGPLNYAYHLDAGAFSDLLRRHSVERFGVRHLVDTVQDVKLAEDGRIHAVRLAQAGDIEGDLFVDCTGFASLLLGKTLGVPFKSTKDVLFNDTALAVQVPYQDRSSPVATHTIATGQHAGWTWDIGLTSRRGVGLVYSSDFISDDEAESILSRYVGDQYASLSPRKIPFEAGFRDQFWKKNCIAVGLSAGFVEPLEATALMLIEISARYIANNLPVNQDVMSIIAKRFNTQMHYRWQRIIDFLKLHYCLTQRPEPYWQAHKNEAHMPESLLEDLAIWRYRGPVAADFESSIELFPAASYQYVMYGMGFKPDFQQQSYLYQEQQNAEQIMKRNQLLTQQMLNSLPPHREYIERWLAQSTVQ